MCIWNTPLHYWDAVLVGAHARTAQEDRLKRISSELWSVGTHNVGILLGGLRLNVRTRLGEAGSQAVLLSALTMGPFALWKVHRVPMLSFHILPTFQEFWTQFHYQFLLKTLLKSYFRSFFFLVVIFCLFVFVFLDETNSRYKVLLPMLFVWLAALRPWVPYP